MYWFYFILFLFFAFCSQSKIEENVQSSVWSLLSFFLNICCSKEIKEPGNFTSVGKTVTKCPSALGTSCVSQFPNTMGEITERTSITPHHCESGWLGLDFSSTPSGQVSGHDLQSGRKTQT